MANSLHPRVVADLASAGVDTLRRLDAALLNERDAAELIDLCITTETYGVLGALGLKGGAAALSAALYRHVEGCRGRADLQRRAQAATPFPEKVLKRRLEDMEGAGWERTASPITEPVRQAGPLADRPRA